MQSFEDINTKRDHVSAEVAKGEEDAIDLEKLIAETKEKLEEVKHSLQRHKKQRHDNDLVLTELEAGGFRAKAAMRKLARKKKQSETRNAEEEEAHKLHHVAELREAFRKHALPDAAKELPSLGSSAECHQEVVVATDIEIPGARGAGGVGESAGAAGEAGEGEEATVAGGAGGAGGSQPIRCRLYSSEAPVPGEEQSPVLVYFHGENFCTGDLDTHDWLCRSFAALAGVQVLAVDYRRAPEHPFPAAAEDAWAAVTWVASGGLGFSPPSLVVAGDSAGGGLAVGCCVRARDEAVAGLEGTPTIAAQVLFYPWMDLRPEAPSLQAGDHDDRFIELLEDMEEGRGWYEPPDVFEEPPPDPPAGQPFESAPAAGDEGSAAAVSSTAKPEKADDKKWYEDLRASPLLASSFAGLPPAFLAYASDDPFAKDSVLFAGRMRTEAGPGRCHTQCIRATLGHGFIKDRHRPEAQTTASAAAAFASATLRACASARAK